jgi:hypothetical protein
VVGHATLLYERTDGVDVALLILAFVVLDIRGSGEFSGTGRPRVSAGNVGKIEVLESICNTRLVV